MSVDGLTGSWASAPLSDVADLQLGKMLDKARPRGRPHLYLRNINVRWDAFDTSDLLSMAFEDDELERFSVHDGDLLVCEGGEPGRAAVWNHGPTDLKFQKALHRIRLSGTICPRWVMYQLMLDASTGRLSRAFTGSTIAHLPREKLAAYELRVAPRGEQERIVEVVDSHMTRLDAAVAALERAQAKLKAYRASVLKSAIEGHLVPTEAEVARNERRAYEPAGALLARTLEQRRRSWQQAELAKLKAAGKTPTDDRWKTRYNQPSPPDSSELPDLPEGWCWTTAEACTDAERSITYGVVLLGEPVESGVPTLRTSNVRHLALESAYVKRIAPEIAAEYRRTALRGGEVLVTVRGTLGGVVVVPESARGWNISREVAMLALVEPRLGRIVADFIASPRLQAWLSRHTKGNTYTGVNIENLKRLPIPLPPLAEAERIADEIDRRLSVVAAASSTATVQVGRCHRLRQSVLRWAFEGRLVDQDPTDEPAVALLARIRAKRVAAGAAKNTLGRKAKAAT